MLRHYSANHRRETIAFSKLRAAVIERAALQLVWMSFMKVFSEKKRDATPAQRLGLLDHRLTVAELLKERLFATRTELPAVGQRYYDRKVTTRRLPQSRRHAHLLRGERNEAVEALRRAVEMGGPEQEVVASELASLQ